MRIRMAVRPTGTRNGAEWPKVGTVIDLPDEEAKALVANGAAVETDEAAGERGEIREAKPWESVGIADHDYPDATGRTGPPLVEVPEQLAVNKVAEPLIVNPDVEEEADGPKVPEDARTASPQDAQGPVVSVEGDATVSAPETAAARNKSKK